mmetsp:Transcript_49207/g.101504  ORF Transcript_49207/g.101504 Transcript_49207/m.101504 type:complete len:348 (-) Transcript_49207:127-1170(-)
MLSWASLPSQVSSSQSEHLRSTQSLQCSSGPPTEVPDHERDLLAKLPQEQLLQEVRSNHASEEPSPLHLLDVERKLLSPRQLPRAAVLVHVYNLTEAFVKANSLLSVATRGTVGAFHVGVEVFGLEWSYGLYGVSVSPPRQQTRHVYKCSVLLGETELNEVQFAAVLRNAFQEFMGEHYDLVGHNCCSFGRHLVKELGVGQMPHWVDRLARGLKKARSSVGRATGRVSEHVGMVMATGHKAVTGAAAALRFGGWDDASEEEEDELPAEEAAGRTGSAGPPSGGSPSYLQRNVIVAHQANGWQRRQDQARAPTFAPGVVAGGAAQWTPPGVVVHRQVGYPPMLRPGHA